MRRARLNGPYNKRSFESRRPTSRQRHEQGLRPPLSSLASQWLELNLLPRWPGVDVLESAGPAAISQQTHGILKRVWNGLRRSKLALPASWAALAGTPGQ